jgi:hypothetical protein
MPCWTVQTSQVNLNGLNEALLRKAVEALGFRINNPQYGYNVQTGAKFSADRFKGSGASIVLEADGRVTVRAATSDPQALEVLTKELKRAYSTEVVKAATARFGWKVQQSTDARTGQTQFKVQRGF